MKEILSSFEALFLQFNVRRLAFWVSLLILVIVVLFLFESQTGYIFFRSMEKKVSLLKELHTLAKADISQNGDLSPIYQELLVELVAYNIEPFSFSRLSSLEGFWKYVSGALLGFIIAIYGLTEKAKGDEKWNATVLGGISIGLIGGFAGILIPTFYSPWLNCLGYPIIQVAVILGFHNLTKKAQAV